MAVPSSKPRNGYGSYGKMSVSRVFLNNTKLQHLYPLELECDVSTQVADPCLNPQAQDFRPRRDAAAAARLQMKQVADVEQCEMRTVNQTSCG